MGGSRSLQHQPKSGTTSLERNSPFALDVDVLVGVDLQTITSQHLFVTFNTEAGKGAEPVLLQEWAQALGPAGG